MKSLLFPGNSRSSRISFFRSFLTLQTCWQSFRLENVTITVSFVLPTRWHASIRSGEISQPSFPKIFKTFSSRTSPDTSQRMPTISRHSHVEYWAFAQHYLSKVPFAMARRRSMATENKNDLILLKGQKRRVITMKLRKNSCQICDGKQ